MPQLIAIGLVGLLAFYAWRVLKREMARIGTEMDREKKERAASEGGALVKGPDGVYRPKRPE